MDPAKGIHLGLSDSPVLDGVLPTMIHEGYTRNNCRLYLGGKKLDLTPGATYYILIEYNDEWFSFPVTLDNKASYTFEILV
jgi:hypothetical protein